MKEVSLHILDVVQNSIHAHPSLITLKIVENTIKNQLIIIIEDDGIGMDKEMQDKVLNPFFTTRKTRKVGLGLPLLQAAAQACGGDLVITSEKSQGTILQVNFQYDHIDRSPLGNMTDTIISIILSLGEIDLVYSHQYNQNEFVLDTREIRKVLGQNI